jgi:SAM-dependent methyltransferase
MHKKVFQKFVKICSLKDIRGSVLEVGATPDDSSLLNMRALDDVKEKIGINIDGPHQYKDFSIMKGNANSMDCFSDGRFDAVLCNAVLEHDKYFWETVSEIKRVTRPGGLIVIAAPGYGTSSFRFLANSARTLKIHNYPGDYYRFSVQAFREVIFEGLRDVEITCVLNPPRIIGFGIKP